MASFQKDREWTLCHEMMHPGGNKDKMETLSEDIQNRAVKDWAQTKQKQLWKEEKNGEVTVIT
jgi:hypothetical protein